jgi:hypothetical protein
LPLAAKRFHSCEGRQEDIRSKFETPRDHICPRGRTQNIMLNLSSFWRCRTVEREPESGYFTIFGKAQAEDIDGHFMLLRPVEVNRKTYREVPVRCKIIYDFEAAFVISYTDSALFGGGIRRSCSCLKLSFRKPRGKTTDMYCSPSNFRREEEPAHRSALRYFGDAERRREDQI